MPRRPWGFDRVVDRDVSIAIGSPENRAGTARSTLADARGHPVMSRNPRIAQKAIDQ